MSRIGKAPITVPAGVDIKIESGNVVTVKGPKGTLTQTLHGKMLIKQDTGVVSVERPNDEKENRSLHGLTRTLINNMVIGVTVGYSKELEINGVGYRAQKQGKSVVMNLGFSHPITIDETSSIALDVPAPNKLIVSGIDKQAVGQFAAEVREIRPPEPYNGKGIKYATEVIRRKEGKTASKKK